jgi:Protein of unknown function (DUF1552)
MKPEHPHNDRSAAGPRTGVSRRNFLRGVGVSLALPTFESLVAASRAMAAAGPAGAMAATPSGAPLRMAYVYVPNGVHQRHWWPNGTGKDFELTRTLQPLEKVKQQVQILGGLDHLNANGGLDGPGDHARASGTFLTGVRVKKTAGADIHAGVSVDQVAAQRIGHLTRFPSLELTCDGVRKSGNCDSGYSCAYQFNLSWSNPTVPVSPEPNPRLVFERLFGAGAPSERRRNFDLRREQQRSILDFVLDDTRALEQQLGGHDQKKLDEYLTSVRQIERRLEQAEQFKDFANPSVETPAGIPGTFQEHIQLMFDMMILAFQTDSTRIATFLLANEGSNRTFPDINIAEGHHNLSHHRNKKEPLDKIADIDRWYVLQFAHFLQKMDSIKDIDGKSLLHNSMIVYGSGNGDGNRHNHDNLPVILAGSAGGTLAAGRHVKFKSQPMSNLYLSMLDRMGVAEVPRLGDSTGRIQGI